MKKNYPELFLDNQLIKNETIIVEDSAVGVKAGVAAGLKVVGLTAGGHWHKNRSKNELLDAGAYTLANSYDDLLKEIKKL